MRFVRRCHMGVRTGCAAKLLECFAWVERMKCRNGGEPCIECYGRFWSYRAVRLSYTRVIRYGGQVGAPSRTVVSHHA